MEGNKLKVLVIGSGANVKNELAIVDRASFDKIIGVNRAAIHFGPVDIHCTLHPKDYGPQKVAWMVSHQMRNGVDEVFECLWNMGGSSGSSGLYAVKYAIEKLESTDITLAGVGMDIGPHYYNPSNWEAAKRFQRTWIDVLPQIKGKVKSLGGWTARLLNEDHHETCY